MVNNTNISAKMETKHSRNIFNFILFKLLVYLQQMSPEHVDDSVDTGLKWAVEHILEGEVQRSPPPITSPRRHQLQVLLYILQSSRLYRLLQVDFVITGKFSIVTFRSRQYFLHCLSFNTDNVFYLFFFV